MSERLRTGLIIIGLYTLCCLYLVFVSYRVTKLDNNSYSEEITTSATIAR